MPGTAKEPIYPCRGDCERPPVRAAAPEKTGRVGGEQESHPGPHDDGEEKLGIPADGAEIAGEPGTTTVGGPALANGIFGEAVPLHGRHEDARQPDIPAPRTDRIVKTRRRFIVLSSCQLASGKCSLPCQLYTLKADGQVSA